MWVKRWFKRSALGEEWIRCCWNTWLKNKHGYGTQEQCCSSISKNHSILYIYMVLWQRCMHQLISSHERKLSWYIHIHLYPTNICILCIHLVYIVYIHIYIVYTLSHTYKTNIQMPLQSWWRSLDCQDHLATMHATQFPILFFALRQSLPRCRGVHFVMAMIFTWSTWF